MVELSTSIELNVLSSQETKADYKEQPVSLQSPRHTMKISVYIPVITLFLCCSLAAEAQGSTTFQTLRLIHPATPSSGISLSPPTGISSHTLTLPATQGAASSYLMNDGSGNLSWQTLGGSTSLSGLTAASAINSINNGDYAQTWMWNSLSSNSALTLSSSSTLATANTQTLLNLSLSGTNLNASQTTYAFQLSNTHGGSGTNVGAQFSASGGSSNYGLLVSSGSVGIATTSPSTLFHVYGNTDAVLASATTGLILSGIPTAANIVIDDNEIMARNNGAKSTLYFQAEGGDFSIHNAQAGGTQLIVKDNGYVGLGTSTPTSMLQSSLLDAGTSAVVTNESIGHNSSATPAAGFGVATKYLLHSSTTTDQDAAQIAALWTTATHASRTSALSFSTVSNAAALSETMRITNAQVGINTTSPTSGSGLDVKGHVALSNAGSASELRLYEPSGSGSNYSAFKAGAQSADISYTLPTSAPTTNQFLETDASGTLSWKYSPMFVRKTADESLTSNTTLQDDDALQFTVGANEVWELKMDLDVYGASGAIKVALVIPSGTLHVYTFQEAGGTEQGEWLTSSGSANTTAITVVDGKTLASFRGIIATAGTGGTVKLQWAQNTASSTTTVKANSYLVAKRWQ